MSDPVEYPQGTGSNDDSWFTAISVADFLNPVLVVVEQ
jgi:hypothetical protein